MFFAFKYASGTAVAVLGMFARALSRGTSQLQSVLVRGDVRSLVGPKLMLQSCFPTSSILFQNSLCTNQTSGEAIRRLRRRPRFLRRTQREESASSDTPDFVEGGLTLDEVEIFMKSGPDFVREAQEGLSVAQGRSPLTAEQIVEVLKDESGQNINLLDISHVCQFADTMIFVQGHSTRHLAAMSSTLGSKVRFWVGFV